MSTVADLLVKGLIGAGYDQLYCLPGVQNDDFFDVVYDHQKELTPIHARHEQGAVSMALGAALATGRPQACSIVPGPGLLNGAATLSTAMAVNAPMLVLSGQIPSKAIGQKWGVLHEIDNHLDIFRSLTKQAERIEGGDMAADQITDALTQVASGRPRPVGLEVPVDVWAKDAQGDVTWAKAQNPTLNEDAIEAAAKLMSAAERPMIFVGSGALDASKEVTALAERLSAPVISHRTGMGIVSRDNPLSMALPMGQRLWAETDLVIALGTRLQTQRQMWGMNREIDIIHVDIDPEQLTRISTPKLAIHGDVADASTAFLAGLGNAPDRSQWINRAAALKAEVAAGMSRDLAPQAGWLNVIRKALPRDGILVEEMTQIGYAARLMWDAFEPRTYLSTGYQGTLGWGFPAALGAAHARRDVPVVSISGDGGALYAITELATAVQHSIPLTTIIFTDNAFGNVKRFQQDNYKGRTIASDLVNPDFVALAKSFGVEAGRATSPRELEPLLTRAIDSEAPVLIEVPVGEFPAPWGYLMTSKAKP